MNLIKKAMLFLLMFAWSLSGMAFADVYYNSRFGFEIKYPGWWKACENTPPANDDGISFALSETCNFSASGMFNVLNNTLKAEVKSRTENAVILKKTALKISGVPAVETLFKKDGIRTLMLVAIKGETVYSCYYSAPEASFNEHHKEAAGVMKSFRIK